MKSITYPFILIDDDPLNNLICQMTIEMVQGKTDIKSFQNPEIGLKYIQSEFIQQKNGDTTILLLDLSMPVMSGWEFLERFDDLSKAVKNSINIYILSSSIDERDQKRSYANKNVRGFLVKPLTKDSINQIVNG
jgi:response regulator RpfG family c-di-GMP phosphodiesterase